MPTRAEGGELTKCVVPATVMLSFISFWRAAAIVLCDLGSSAYYVGGIAEKAIGKAAPWFILGIMLFSYAVRAVYIESCSMFVRGGVYRVVRHAMGGTAAKLSVSALLFDYVLTGPISGVSAGLYLAGLLNELGAYLDIAWIHVPTRPFATGFAVLVTLYFGYTNRIGVPFSSTKALRIMQVTTAMVIVLIGWSALTVFTRGSHPVPLPTLANLHFSDEALGWLKGTGAAHLAFLAVLIGFGHSLLAMSGEESLAQVYREIEAPKHRNLIRTGLVIFVFSLVFTAGVSFLAVMLIPDAERPSYFDNLIGGIAMVLVGPVPLRLAFHALVVLAGVLILSGAVNTAVIGANGVLNRVAEDRVLPVWFREPHPTHGTTYRIINLIIGLQLATILISRGNVDQLGEAYAFGVAWSFAMKALAVIVLRYTAPDVLRWRVPLNLRARGRELPVGLILITTGLFLLAGINLLTKTTATIAGSAFTAAFFLAFTISERSSKAAETRGASEPCRVTTEEREEERFRLEVREFLSPEALSVRPGNILVAVHDPENLRHLRRVLEDHDPAESDVIALSVNPNAPRDRDDLTTGEQVMDECETRIFSHVVYAAERVGKPVALVAVPGGDVPRVILQAAKQLHSARVVVSQASQASREDQEREFRRAWQRVRPPRPAISLEIVPRNDEEPVARIEFGADGEGTPRSGHA